MHHASSRCALRPDIHIYRRTWGAYKYERQRRMGPTDAAGLLRGPLVVFLAGDVLLAHQLEGGKALEVQPVAVTEACAFPFAVGGNPGISAAALLDLCGGRKTNSLNMKKRGETSQLINKSVKQRISFGIVNSLRIQRE